jgi:hypothetical protein
VWGMNFVRKLLTWQAEASFMFTQRLKATILRIARLKQLARPTPCTVTFQKCCQLETTHTVRSFFIEPRLSLSVGTTSRNCCNAMQRGILEPKLAPDRCSHIEINPRHHSFQRMPDRRVPDDNFIRHVRLLPHPQVSDSKR